MSFTSSISGRSVFGNKRVVMGPTAQISGDLGGTIETGLSKVDFFTCSMNAHVVATGGSVAVTTKNFTADQDGFWMAMGI